MFYARVAQLSLALAALCSVASANENLGKRAALLESRQSCSTAGWIPACPGPYKCIPPGGICCSDGVSYAMPPETCPDGTQPIATAPLSSVVVPSVTPAPTSTRTVVQYTWYTITYTWYYYYYYYTYIAVQQTTLLTSSQVSSITTLSVTATNSAQASSLFESIKQTLSLHTPTQTATPTNGYTTTPSSVATTSSKISVNGTGSVYPTNSPTFFTGAASAVTVGTMASFSGGAVYALAALLAVPGVLMVWL